MDPVMKLDNCKACRETVHLTEEEIKQIFGDALRAKEVKLVTEELYGQRMAICTECDALQYGTTCKHCGCIVAVKAKFVNSRCPFPFNPKW